VNQLATQFSPSPSQVASKIRQSARRHQHPFVVAIDGGSGAGKSTLALILAEDLEAALIPMDDFYAADIPDHHWDGFSVEERFRRSFDWERIRDDVLKPLRAGKPATWHAFDFISGLRPDGTYAMQTEPKILEPANVILIDGAFSASPALADLVDYTILVELPVEQRHAHTAAREDPLFLQRWHLLWDPVEDYYHNHLRPSETYDLVVSG
jgi:uridine kinase